MLDNWKRRVAVQLRLGVRLASKAARHTCRRSIDVRFMFVNGFLLAMRQSFPDSRAMIRKYAPLSVVSMY